MKPKVSRVRDWIPYMDRAIELAHVAQEKGDVPIGALILDRDGKIIAEAHNERELSKDPTAHAEILALRRASEHLASWRLLGCTLVVTLEPCVMCAGALSLSRIDRVIYGASDPKAGAMGSLYEIQNDKRLNHPIDYEAGVRNEECRKLLVDFFRAKRQP